ncbi:hypothetical protein PGB34_21960 [Xenophilus arseniciresistens]|uniref:Uncharacterized protein n=1 Tax=Xenophilus arseniciresistens TaxID=1283306 RepID=A0AAE3T1W5_9BURK|nr:hypothetical protein [Xenophilus arseniciresistens]MDA7419045.1 hypothetical protein [Xenophilus arseniciresistens]
MSSFVHVEQPLSHPGVARAEQVIGYVQSQRGQFTGSRGLSAVLLAGIVAALAAVADKFVTHWTDGSLLAAWMVLWLVVFIAMAMFAGAARNLAARGLVAWQGVQRRMAAASADAQLLETARRDPRVMSDLKAAMTRGDTWEPRAAAAAPAAAKTLEVPAAPMPTVYEAMRRMNSSRYY